MFPSIPSVYPEYVPDQVLTAHDLNESFYYLDEQGRMTRTNLIGIGIVCGLNVQINPAQNEITITKGVGVTSEGYLVTVPEATYSKYVLYGRQLEEKTYDRYVNAGPPKSKKFNLWELKKGSDVAESIDLTPGFLANKIVMIFVELLEVGNKNCDPNSCDDKGKHYEVNFVPLLVLQSDASTLIGSMGNTITADTFTSLPEIRMRRFDVPNTNPVSSEDIFNAYKSILNGTFLSTTETALSQAYSIFSIFITTEFPSDPFTGLATDFAFINNGTITADQLKHIQYYYDLFSDFLLAYKEFRKTGNQIISACCPDAALFPRHLLLGEAIPLGENVKSMYRHYFIYSPLFEQKNLLNELKSLFKKLVLLMQKFFIPPVSSGPPSSKTDPNIRITPSLLQDTPLSTKAIPYYYNPVSGPSQLYKFWSFEKSMLGKPQFNLSYNANQYNAVDDFIINPLNYDLEPYNFLRIEGIIGKQYIPVLKNIKHMIHERRLPVDVIALNTDNIDLSKTLKSGSVNNNLANSGANSIDVSSALSDKLPGMLCHFQDLEAMYDTMKNEMLCTLCKELKYYYELKFNFSKATDPNATDMPSVVGLFNSCNTGYVVKKDSFGFLIEKVYKQVGDQGSVTIQAIAQALGIDDFLGNNNNAASGNFTGANSIMLGYVTTLFEIPIYIIRLANTFTSDLSAFDVDQYCQLQSLLAEKANSLKFLFTLFTASERQDLRSTGFNVMNSGNTTMPSTSPPIDSAGGPNTPPPGVAFNNSSSNMSLFNAVSLSQSGAGRVLLLIFLLEDFFDHLDVLIYNCKCSAFKSLREEYLKRLAYILLLRQFGYFTKMHPGIQHKAGVPMGGTFIVVYHSRKEKGEGPVGGRFYIVGNVRDVSGAPLPGVSIQAEGTAIGATTDPAGQFFMIVHQLPVVLVASVMGMQLTKVIVTTQGPVSIIVNTSATNGNGNEENPDGSVLDTIEEGTVIADFYLPYRCCSDCPPIQYVIRDRDTPPPDANLSPVANAGPDQVITLPINSVRLNGSGSTDPDGTIVSFEWLQVSGPTALIRTPGSAQTDIENLVEGTYRFNLIVTDNGGAKAGDEVMVTVNPAPAPANQPPVANAGDDFTFTLSATNTAFLNGSLSNDPDGSILIFSWGQVSGPNIAGIPAANSVQSPLNNLVPGVYEFELKVTDNKGSSATDRVEVTVEAAPNTPPVANAGGNSTVFFPNIGTLDGSASFDAEGAITDFAWTQLSGPNTSTILSPAFPVSSITGLVPGVYEYELKVKDSGGLEAKDKATVTVRREGAQRQCNDFGKIMDIFKSFPDVDPTNIGQFTEFYRPYINEIVPMFEKFGPGGSAVTSLSPEDQVAFFLALQIQSTNAAGAVVNLTLLEALQKWLSELHNLIIIRPTDTRAAITNKNRFRLLVLSLYRILLQLITYIICIQRRDMNVADLPMDGIMKLVEAHIREWMANLQQFKQPELDVVKKIGDDLKGELARLATNNDSKPNYKVALEAIINLGI